MRTLLVNISFVDEAGKYWHQCLNNELISFDPIKETVHECIAGFLKDNHCVTLTYKAKPNGNVWQDTDKEPKRVGYTYRGKSEVRVGREWKQALWTVWVTIQEVEDFQIENIDDFYFQ